MQPISARMNLINNQKGLTLIEIMLVVAILAGLVAIGFPRLRPPGESIKSATRELTVLIREIRHEARLKDQTQRLVFNLDDTDPKFWVEFAAGRVLAKSQEEILAEMQNQNSEDEEAPRSPFQRSERFSKKDRTLPKGLVFGSVENKRENQPVTEGLAFVYFSPEGLIEQAAIQITNRDQLTWTLVINPLTGQTDIVERPLRLEELKVE